MPHKNKLFILPNKYLMGFKTKKPNLYSADSNKDKYSKLEVGLTKY